MSDTSCDAHNASMDARGVMQFWDQVVDRYLDGEFPLDGPLRPWFDSYRGSGEGAVDPEVMPEPYLGDLEAGDHRMIFLGLNPGSPRPRAQSRSGTYAEEIRALGSYHAWAATWPYLRPEDLAEWGRNKFHDSRFEFMKNWYGDRGLQHAHMLNWELYPWHSKKVMGSRMRPPAEVIKEFVWEPVGDLAAPWVFAFGREWFGKLGELGLRPLVVLGYGGEPYPTLTKPGARRSVKVWEGPEGIHVVAMSTAAAAAPPSRVEANILKEELAKRGFSVPG